MISAFFMIAVYYLVTHMTTTAKTSNINNTIPIPTILEPAFFCCSGI